MNTISPIDWDEMFEYLPGTIVELKSEPGILYQIDCYETSMVPPIWLVGNPRPRYPYQMRIVSRQQVKACGLEFEPSLA